MSSYPVKGEAGVSFQSVSEAEEVTSARTLALIRQARLLVQPGRACLPLDPYERAAFVRLLDVLEETLLGAGYAPDLVSSLAALRLRADSCRSGFMLLHEDLLHMDHALTALETIVFHS